MDIRTILSVVFVWMQFHWAFVAGAITALVVSWITKTRFLALLCSVLGIVSIYQGIMHLIHHIQRSPLWLGPMLGNDVAFLFVIFTVIIHIAVGYFLLTWKKARKVNYEASGESAEEE